MPTVPSIHHFAAFVLDPHRRRLTLEGREIPLQPRVFDLLSYLVEHRDRVVSKEELLDKLWPGVVVTESSLQRAVSLVRSALQQGGLEGAIRNYARRGYRFLIEETQPAEPVENALALAERTYATAQWREAMRAFAAADLLHSLDADSLERWGIAAQCAGELTGAMAPLERAAVVYSSRGEREAGARVLVSLARIQMESLDLAVAQGCLNRAGHLLSGLPQGEPHGYLAWMSARLHLNKGELHEAILLAQEARDIGHALGNADIESMGMVLWGIALQAIGDEKSGQALQDEACATVLAGSVSPLVGGLVYCGMISSCCNGEDWVRAGQWTESFMRWCQRSNIDTFAGACLIHQAEVFASAGELQNAWDAILRADPLIQIGAPWALGDAHRLMGDVLLARGELDEAERSFQQAYQHGWEPYPGYAELLHLRGRGEEALRGLKRAATLTHWVPGERKARYLALATRIAAELGRLEEARALLHSLAGQPHMGKSDTLAGQVEYARAAVALAEGHSDQALDLLHRALALLHKGGAVMEMARAHLRLAELLIQMGEHGAANMELSAAERVFKRSGAKGYLEQCEKLRKNLCANQ